MNTYVVLHTSYHYTRLWWVIDVFHWFEICRFQPSLVNNQWVNITNFTLKVKGVIISGKVEGYKKDVWLIKKHILDQFHDRIMNYNVRTNVSLLYFHPKPNKNNNNSTFSSIIVFVSKSVKYLAVTMGFCTCELKVDSKTLIYSIYTIYIHDNILFDLSFDRFSSIWSDLLCWRLDFTVHIQSR